MTATFQSAVILCTCLLACSASVLKFKSRNTENDINKDRPDSLTLPKDCQDHWDDGERSPGVFTIFPNGTIPVQVYCLHTATNTASVIQRRYNGKENFQRPWKDYAAGFGTPQADYWIGLDTMHHLTYLGTMRLQIHLEDWQGHQAIMTYTNFVVYDETQKYRLYVNGAVGQLPDDLTFNSGMFFATYDRPDINNCALNQNGGWWFNYCTYTFLNGHYYKNGRYYPNPKGYYDGIYYKDWLGYDYSLKRVTMALVKK